MILQLTGRRVRIDEALWSLADRKLNSALDRWEDLAGKRVDIRFIDVNGQRGGKDKFCRITLENDGAPLIVDATEETVEWALSTAVDRLAKRIRRGRKRARALKRRERTEPLGWWN